MAVDWVRGLPLLAAVAVLAAAGAGLARRHALRHGLLDLPGERRSHRLPTPRGGGIGIAIAWAAACLVLGAIGVLPGPLAAAGAAGVVLVGGVGWIDDHRPLSPWWRLAAHAVAGALLAVALAMAGASTWLALLALAGVPVLVNVWNFMDGIDGLAASQAALAALGFALLSGEATAAWPALALAAACLGFLPFNVPRARIFLGDVGSGVLGYALALVACAFLLQGGEGGDPSRLPLAFLLLSAFLIDASLTLAMRMLRGEQWWRPHVEHAYQRLAAGLGSHLSVTLAFAAWTLAATGLAVAARSQLWTFRLCAVVAAAWAAAGMLAWYSARSFRPHRQHKERP